jgi:CBS-domain-containing membrane protein
MANAEEKLRAVRPSGGHKNNPAMAALSHMNVMDTIVTREYRGPTGEVVTVPHTATFLDVAKCLKVHHISAVPVLRNNIVECLVDYQNLANFLLTEIRDPQNVEAEELKSLSEKLTNVTLHEMCGALKHPHMGESVNQNTSAADVAALFSEGIFRVAVSDGNKHLTAICSQSDLIRHLATIFDRGGDSSDITEFGKKKMLHCLHDKRDIESLKISGDATVASALQKLQKTGASLLCVEGPGGQAMEGCNKCDTFTAKDIHGIWDEHGKIDARILAEPLQKFLAHRRPHDCKIRTLGVDSSLSDTVKYFAEEKVHHAIFKQDSGKVVVEMTDVFKVITMEK